uniref:hypothetical protein n=7 Tax=Mycobacterium tuberculosis TaxID=1773 RepID=UPI001F376001
MNETFTGAAQVDADASPQADGAPSAARIVTGLSRLPGSSSGRYAARIVTGLSRLPGSSSGRYAARIVTGLRLDCPAPPRAATRRYSFLDHAETLSPLCRVRPPASASGPRRVC